MLAPVNGFAFKLSGETIVRAPAATIEVRREDTGALASIYSNEVGTMPITNPSAFADANGSFRFYAAGLSRGYRIDVTDGGFTASYRNVAIGTAAQIDLPAIGSDGHVLTPSAGAALWLPPGARAERIINGQIVESHVSNAVTYTLKGKGGIDLSATNPCYLLFPSATLTSGDFDIVKLTANISVTVSSGSTLGHASAIAQHTFVYALKTGSTAELFVSNLPPDYPGTFLGQRLVSTTAEGGAGAADSATGVYSTTERAGVPWLPVAKVKGTQTTAGTWASDPTQIDMAPFAIPGNVVLVRKSNAAQSINNATWTKITIDAEDNDPDSVFDAVTNNRYQPNVADFYRINLAACFENVLGDLTDFQVALYKNGGEERRQSARTSGNSLESRALSATALANGTTDYFELHVFQNQGVAQNIKIGSAFTYFTAERVGAS